MYNSIIYKDNNNILHRLYQLILVCIYVFLLHIHRFAPLFKDIETEIQDEGHLGIDSYGTSMPTLEEVFLRLGDEEKQNDSVGTAATAAEKDFVVDDQKLVQQVSYSQIGTIHE